MTASGEARSKPGGAGPPADILDSWKRIAAYLERDVRTVMRWERSRALPVRRLPGGPKPAVYALRSDLDYWRANGPSRLAESATGARAVDAPSIAVLPLASLTSDEQDLYFGDGLADEIINALAQVPGLRVIARSSSFVFRGGAGDVREIGARLNVGTLLEGSVRRVGDHLRVCAQLVETRDGYHLWSRSFDGTREDPIALQDDIARAIVHGLKLKLLSPARLVRRPPRVARAYELWLEGRSHQLGRRSLESLLRSRLCYEQSLALDPCFAVAQLGLAEHFREMALLGLLRPRDAATAARAAAERALDLDPLLGEARAILGVLRAFVDFDWRGAERAFRESIDLSPASAEGHSRFAMYVLAPMRRFEEAREQLDLTLSLDPLSPENHCLLARLLLFERRLEDADAAVAAALRLSPDQPLAHWLRGAIRLSEGRLDEACVHAVRALGLFGEAPMALAAVSALHAFAGRAEESRALSERLDRHAERSYVSPLFRAWIHAGMGERDAAFRRLSEAVDERDPQAPYLACDHPYDALRHDPRFAALLGRMGLPGPAPPGGSAGLRAV
jgi:TolB-like protein/Flp pilus assembly protein TadD